MRIVAGLSSFRSNVFGVRNQIVGKRLDCCPAVIDGAKRMRIKALRAGLDPLGLIGMRAKLELRIAEALYKARKLPQDGIIVIADLQFTKNCFVPEWAIALERRLNYGMEGGETFNADNYALITIEIQGFSFDGGKYRFTEPMIYSYLA